MSNAVILSTLKWLLHLSVKSGLKVDASNVSWPEAEHTTEHTRSSDSITIICKFPQDFIFFLSLARGLLQVVIYWSKGYERLSHTFIPLKKLSSCRLLYNSFVTFITVPAVECRADLPWRIRRPFPISFECRTRAASTPIVWAAWLINHTDYWNASVPGATRSLATFDSR